ncbi:MAG: FtsX-like permease family protein [Bryobacteraceae bacterium]|jgi:ABC-type antimicrobial peptide transport system permease subunit
MPFSSRQRIVEDKKESDIVGVVADTKYANLREASVPGVYSSITQGMNKDSYTALVRINGAPGPVIAAGRSIVRRIAPEVPAPEASNMEGLIDESLASERMMALLALFFAAFALLITAVGLYGTLAYTSARRTGEIGIRMALGAQRNSVLKLVCQENIAIAIGGFLAGLIASLAASRFIASFLYNTSPRNPVIISVAALLLVTIASAASLIPAIRASRIVPMTAIRHEQI